MQIEILVIIVCWYISESETMIKRGDDLVYSWDLI